MFGFFLFNASNPSSRPLLTDPRGLSFLHRAQADKVQKRFSFYFRGKETKSDASHTPPLSSSLELSSCLTQNME